MSHLSVQNSLPSPAPSPMDGQQSLQRPQQGQSQGEQLEPEVLRSTLERELFKLGQNLYELEICAGDVAQDREEAVPDYLWKINQSFQLLSNLSAQVTDSVPRQVVENIDQFKNPHLYTKNALSRATGENQYALGRLLGLETFRRQLHTAISQAFPSIPLPERRHIPSLPSADNRPGSPGDGGGKDDRPYTAVDAGMADETRPDVKMENGSSEREALTSDMPS